MIILSIETSCDDTGIALVEKKNGKLKKIASALSSQEEVHKKWGGVYPSEAKREHQKNIIPALFSVLDGAGFLEKGETEEPKGIEDVFYKELHLLEETKSFFKNHKLKKKIDAIAVTTGPGLEPCLWVGVNFAKALSLYLKTPVIPVNHIKAHILYFLFKKEKIAFPAVALIVSGGHTELVLMESFSSYKLIGKTRDDAAGECFDKTARILGLEYPGGPQISKRATSFKEKAFSINLPRPMKHTKNYDFSFSGLKTAVLYDFLSRDKKTQENDDYITEMAYEVEEAITDVLVFKLKKAIKEYRAQTVVIGGGVTANKKLQKKIKELQGDFSETDFILPDPGLSTDNAEIIAAAASIEKSIADSNNLKAEANLKIYKK